MSNNWNLTEADEADSSKVLTMNTEMANIIAGVGNSITETFASDANRTPTAATVLAAYRISVTSGVSLTATRDLILPLKKKTWVISNNTSGSQSIRVIGASGTGVTIPNAATVEVVCDGTNFVQLRFGDAIYAYKPTDQTLIGSSYADVTLTGLPVEANATYAFEFYILIDSDATTTGIDVAVNGPTLGAGSIYYEQVYWTSATVFATAVATAYNNDTANTTSNGTAARMFVVKGILRNGANAGTLIARAKREAVGTGPNVRAGSYGKLTRLS